MSIAERAHKALDLDQIDLPASPSLVAIEVEDYVAWTGKDALRVTVTIPDETELAEK